MSIVSCPNCGHPNVDSAKFCAKCGNKLTSGETLVMGGASDPNMPLPSTGPSSPPRREPTPPMSTKEQAAFSPPTPAYTPPAYTPPPARPPAAPPPAAPAPVYTPGAAAYGGAASYGGGQPAAPMVEPAAGGHRFVAMRTIAGLCNVLAIISLVLGFLGGLVWGYILGSNFIGLIGGVLGGLIVGAIAGGLGWVYWRLLGEGIWVILEIADNTRRTAAALERQQRS